MSLKTGEAPQAQRPIPSGIEHEKGVHALGTDSDVPATDGGSSFSLYGSESGPFASDPSRPRGINPAFFTGVHPLKVESKQGQQALAAAKSAISRMPVTKDWKTAGALVRKAAEKDISQDQLFSLWKDYYRALVELEKQYPSLKSNEEFQREKNHVMHQYP